MPIKEEIDEFLNNPDISPHKKLPLLAELAKLSPSSIPVIDDFAAGDTEDDEEFGTHSPIQDDEEDERALLETSFQNPQPVSISSTERAPTPPRPSDPVMKVLNLYAKLSEELLPEDSRKEFLDSFDEEEALVEYQKEAIKKLILLSLESESGISRIVNFQKAMDSEENFRAFLARIFKVDQNLLETQTLKLIGQKVLALRQKYANAQHFSYLTNDSFNTQVQRRGEAGVIDGLDNDTTITGVTLSQSTEGTLRPPKVDQEVLFPGDKIVAAANFTKTDGSPLAVKIEQDYTGRVRDTTNYNDPKISQEAKERAAMKVAELALLNYDPKRGPIVINADKDSVEQAKLVMGCLGYLMRNGYPHAEVKSFVPGVESIEQHWYKPNWVATRKAVNEHFADAAITPDMNARHTAEHKAKIQEIRELAAHKNKLTEIPNTDETKGKQP